MTLHRQSDHLKHKTFLRTQNWSAIVRITAYRPRNAASSPGTNTPAILAVTAAYKVHATNLHNQVQRSKQISNINFTFNYNRFSDADYLSLFIFRKQDILRVMDAVEIQANGWKTKRNRYYTDGVLSTCVVLRRLDSSAN